MGAPHLKITTALGNGAPFFAPPNFNRPRTNLISLACIAQSCHQRVSVRLGTSSTTIFPALCSSIAFSIHERISLYGGFTKHGDFHSRIRPLFPLPLMGHGSSTNRNSSCSAAYTSASVLHSSVVLENKTRFTIPHSSPAPPRASSRGPSSGAGYPFHQTSR